jgi:hypothetical protein
VRNTVGPTVNDYEYLVEWHRSAHSTRVSSFQFTSGILSDAIDEQTSRELCQPRRVSCEQFFDRLAACVTVPAVMDELAKRAYYEAQCCGCHRLLVGPLALSMSCCHHCDPTLDHASGKRPLDDKQQPPDKRRRSSL